MNEKSDPPGHWKNPLFVENAGAEKLAHSLLLGETLRQKVSSGWALGTFILELPGEAVLSSMSLAGFDFVVLDMEHSAIDFSSLENLITAGHVCGLATLVRIWGEDTGLIGKVLDMGANGIMAPHVDTPERARSIVEQTRFAPLGNRSFSPLTKYDSLSEPLKKLGESTYVVIQIEGRTGMERASEIASVPGIDAVFVGPYDLALSLGVPPGDARVYAAAEKLAGTVSEHIGLGIYIDNPGHCGEWASRRFSLQCVSFDGRMLANGARSVVEQARSGMVGRKNQAGKTE